MERVAALEGELPLLVVAPHGPDDHNTDIIAEKIAAEMDAYAVINYGWRRSEKVDYWKDQANCNNVAHLQEDVVKEEFLDPILRFKSRCIRDFGFCYMFCIHGVGNYVRKKAQDDSLDLIIGYGAGKPPSFSCEPRLKDAFIYYAEKHGFGAYEGAAGGQFAGKAKNNLNQLFRRWYPNQRVHSLQIEIVREFREDKEIAEIAAMELASIMDDLLEVDDTTDILIQPKAI